MKHEVKKVWILGATSTIAISVARLYAEQGCELLLVARSQDKLEQTKQDLLARGAAAVEVRQIDLANEKNKLEKFQEMITAMNGFDVLLLAYGKLSDQDSCMTDLEALKEDMNTNLVSAMEWLTCGANHIENAKQGCLAVISSVAGDRGRRSNYVYGSAKSSLSTFAQGLQHRLSVANGHVTLIKPGFVDTAMTSHLPKNGLWAKPDQVAKDIVKGIQKKKTVVFTPWFWRFIMLIIIHLPEKIFRRINI